MSSLGWWARYLVMHLPRKIWWRVTKCRKGHQGPFHDCAICLTCYFVIDKDYLKD